MSYKVVREAQINLDALNTATVMCNALRDAAIKTSITEYGYVTGAYTKNQLKEMVRVARMQLQKFSNDLERESEWVDEK